ncbi:hypothetical protein AAG747_14430 [Rapidithrix thailandica]|uniref:DUF2007 domain-containing protein n=1 Tax=Rapidithrix thailandica TaxID=413964 RepID=A0AAW9SE24_9BACT
METKYLAYRRFHTQDETEDVVAILKKHKIPYQISDESPTFDITFLPDNRLQKEYQIKLKKEDFEKVNELLKNEAHINLEEVPKDYYLFQFSDDELWGLLHKPDEWSAYDYQIAWKVLQSRGHTISEELLEQFKQERVKTLAQPTRGQRSWIVAGYIFSVLGGVVGLFIGWHLMVFKRTLPDGRRVYGYSEKNRKHGRTIFILSLIIGSLWFLAAVGNSFF